MDIKLEEIVTANGSTLLRGSAVIGLEHPDMQTLTIALAIPTRSEGTLAELREEFLSFARQALREDVLQAHWKLHAQPLPALPAV